jgi:hypothetical protein
MTDTSVTTSEYGAIVEQLLLHNHARRIEMCASGANTTYFPAAWVEKYCTVRVKSAPGVDDIDILQCIAEMASNISVKSVVIAANTTYSNHAQNSVMSRMTAIPSRVVNFVTAADVERMLAEVPVEKIELIIDHEDPEGTLARANNLAAARLQNLRDIQMNRNDGYKQFFVYGASHVLKRIDEKTFYRWVVQYAGCKNPHVILLG